MLETNAAGRTPAAGTAASGFALFDTAIGRCGIAWQGTRIVSVQLPESRDAETRARLLRRVPDGREAAPPDDVRRAVEAIVALLRGGRGDLSAIALAMDRVPPFHRRVYELVRTIEPGRTLTYGEVAAGLGLPGSARAVGQALGRNPFPLVVPCHRVLAADGRPGGFSATGGVTTKLRLLAIEGAHANGTASLFEGDGTLGFDPAAGVEHVRQSDARMARLIEAVGPFRLRLHTTPSLFGALGEAIVYQQLTAKAAATIYARVCALFPRGHLGPTPEQILRVSDERLRAAGLSRPKLLSLRDLARRAADGEIPTLAEVHRLENEAIVERLTKVRGIGRWTVEMLLIFRLGRPDVLPLDDYGIRKGFAAAFRTRELPSRAQLERRGERWRPYRTVASWYLWRAAERPTNGG